MRVIYLFPILCAALASAFADGSYFPVKTKDGGERLTKFEAQWYSKSLERMKEPSLPELAKDANAEAYRVIILPTWGNSIVVRVQRLGKIFKLSARRLDGQAGYDPGKLVESKDIDLSAEDSSSLETLVKSLNSFKLSTDEKGIYGEDGEEWVLEGVSQGRYHVVRRWSASSYKPAERGLTAFLDLFKFLLDKSDLSERPKNKGYKLM